MSEYIGRRFAAVTPSDATVLGMTKGLYVGTAGNVAVKHTAAGTAVVFSNVPAGTFLPIEVRLVMSTSTTASNIVAIY
jgi:hypothetical protein